MHFVVWCTCISVAMNPVSSERNRKSMKTQQRMETVGKEAEQTNSLFTHLSYYDQTKGIYRHGTFNFICITPDDDRNEPDSYTT